jgi:hypothetical protein
MATVDCSDDFPRPPVFIVVMHDKKRVYDRRYPQEETQEEIQQSLYRFPGKENGNRRKKKS